MRQTGEKFSVKNGKIVLKNWIFFSYVTRTLKQGGSGTPATSRMGIFAITADGSSPMIVEW